MMTSNSSDPVQGGTASVAASAPESTPMPTQTPATEYKGPTLDTLRDAAKKAQDGLSGTTPQTMAAVGEKSADPARPTAPVIIPPATPAYDPNFKYKAFGKEKEIEEFWRPLVKDADSEKKVKDVFTKAEAFDDLKSKHDYTNQELQTVLMDHQALDKDVTRVMKFRNNKDYDNFFAALRIPDQEIFDWAERRLKSLETPEQRQMAEMQARERHRAVEMEEQNHSLQTQYQTQAVQARTMQLDMVLGRTDVSRVASLWDEKQGRIGSFRDLVIEEAQKIYYSTGQDVSAEEVTNQVMQRFGKLVEGVMATQQAPQAPVVQQSPLVTAKPVIPVTQGRGTSPVKKAPKSLDDLKQMYKQLQASGS